ncbi:DUF6272 family protein [Candidatus Parabeggiatoa sp. HSG14]|uniref:DUF6272 family protein n=1 Tax=Candidatus Parabeggiatoa sp. HSG14 TaxID=3055593 RepID=UPI0025A7364C|nr:DUF6272 family protein [Thiotrichales bacterium HSG14]
MVQIFGEFKEKPVNTQEYLVLGFSPNAFPLKQRWRNNGLSADFLADYMTTFLPTNDKEPVTLDKQAEIKGGVSYVANELLENAMKFNDDNSQKSISIQFQLYADHLVLTLSNSIPPKDVKKFQNFIQDLLQSDPQEFYIRQIEQSENNGPTTSGLGLLTMMDDYMAKLGWKFETIQQNPEVIMVTTRVQLAI